MEWIRKHVDTVIILTAFGTSVLWMNGKFNEVEKEIASLRTDIAVMKTVMIMKNIMPVELAQAKE